MRTAILWVLVATTLTDIAIAAEETPFSASTQAIALDKQIDWSRASLIAVQDERRYKTLDSFARETITDMRRSDHLPALSPMASLMEWLFNRPAYADSPVVHIKDRGVLMHLAVHLPDDKRQRILQSGNLTPRELADPTVRSRLSELETRALMSRAMQRVRDAVQVAERIENRLRFVPQPGAPADARWFTPDEILPNIPADFWAKVGAAPPEAQKSRPVSGLSGDQALAVILKWSGLRQAWLAGDAPKVQKSLDELATTLETLADPGVYPSASQRHAEARYYAMGKFTWGWVFYFLGAIVSVWCLATPWRTPWIAALILLVAGLTVHAYGISLRWYILGRIPVANMFEAILASAWMCIALALVVGVWLRSRVFLFGAHATGFMALMLASFVLPSLSGDGAGNLAAMMGILDNVMLRIHTVMIIASYALIFLAAMIALVYLVGYYVHIDPAVAMKGGVVVAVAGLALLALTGLLFHPAGGASASGYLKREHAELWFGLAATGLFLVLPFLIRFRLPGPELVMVIAAGVVSLFAAIGGREFMLQTGIWAAASAAVWSGIMLTTLLRRAATAVAPAPELALPGGGSMGAPTAASGSARAKRPIMAGAMPGDEGRAAVPEWLHQLDWSHLIILNIVFVMLFVGTILGAVWADYSWGRPWGWDPKEVFAMNTWIIYAILIHVRFIVKQRGLWTAWLSLAGCAMMAFNWFFVNFFIVGMHSYA